MIEYHFILTLQWNTLSGKPALSTTHGTDQLSGRARDQVLADILARAQEMNTTWTTPSYCSSRWNRTR